MKRIACQIALLALALPLAACNERPRNDDGPKNVAPKGKEPAGADKLRKALPDCEVLSGVTDAKS